MFWEIYSGLCKQKGLSANTVAKILSISSGTVTGWKNGRAPLNSTLKKIADYFGVSVDYLLGKEDEKKPTATEDSELGEDVVIFHRDGKTQKRKLTKEQMDMLVGMLNAIPEDGEGL